MEIPILSTLVGYLAQVMRIGLTACYHATVAVGFPSYGIAIIVLTLIIKMLLLPLALKQIHSMKGMQELQPKMKVLQKKYKNDKKQFQIEMQKLYQENGVSPLSGCLPLLIQMPFLIAIFYALQGYPYDPEHQSFLWLSSLAEKDTTYILPILSGLSTFIISWQTTPKDAQGNQKMMLYIMPVFITYISLSFPSGLVIYWVVCNIFQFVQQFFMFRDKSIKKTVDSRTEGVVTVYNDDKHTGQGKGSARRTGGRPSENKNKKRVKKPVPSAETAEKEDHKGRKGSPAKESLEGKETAENESDDTGHGKDGR